MEIVITGVTGMRNRGVEAMVRPTLQHLRSRTPNTKVTVLTWSPHHDSQRLRQESARTQGSTEFTHDLFTRDPASQGLMRRVRARASAVWRGGETPHARIKSLLARADAVVALGGDIFSSHYDFRAHMRPLEYAIDQGVPVIFLAQSIGPFVSADEARVWSDFARRVQLITTREHRSYTYVTQTLDVRGPRVAHTSDISFLLDPEPGAFAGLSRLYSLNEAAPRIALAPNAHMAGYAEMEPRQHRETWQQLVTSLLSHTDAEIVVLPHVQETWPNHDDRQFATELVRTLGYPDRVRLIGGDHSAAEFKALISTCALTVGERMHAVLAALSSGRCAVPVAYSVKGQGITEDLLGEAAASDLVIQASDCTPSSFVRSVLDAWHRRSEIEAMLKASLPAAKRRARENFDLLAAVVGQSHRLGPVDSSADVDGSAASMTVSAANSRSFPSRDGSADRGKPAPRAAPH